MRRKMHISVYDYHINDCCLVLMDTVLSTTIISYVRDLVLTAFSNNNVPGLSCPTENGYYEYYHNARSRMCLRLELDNAADWTTAQDNCKLDGGHLADFETDQDFADIADYIANVRGTDGCDSRVEPMKSKLVYRTSAKYTQNELQMFIRHSQRITTE